MYFYRNRLFIACIVIAIISIVQTVLHFIWLWYGHSIFDCEYKPTNLFVYLIDLTYFYREKCTTVTLIDKQLLCDSFTKELFESENKTICRFALDFNDRALFKEEFGSNTLQSMHIFDLIGTLDCLWIVASVALLMGSCVKIKEAWSILFYAPWLILTSIMSVADVLLTCKFVSDIEKTNSVTKWLKFMGVKNYEDFSEYDNQISERFTTMASIIMCILACRLGIFTLANIFSIFIVLKASISAYNMSYIDETFRRRSIRPKVLNDNVPNNDINLNATAARIRNWQIFYGTEPSNIDSENTHQNSKDNTLEKQLSEKDLNSNNVNESKEVTIIIEHNETDKTCDFIPSVSIIEAERHVDYIEMEGTEITEFSQKHKNHSTMDELRGQLPWSYFPKEEDSTKKTPLQAKSILKKPSEYTDNYPRHSSSLSISASKL